MLRLGAVLVILGALAPTARAIPPFARRYGFSCTTCHAGGPTKLSAFGEAFRNNGYHVPGDDAAFWREPPMPLGAPARAALFPHAVWPGEIPATTPVGVAGQVGLDATLTPPASADRSSLAFPASVSLLFGGSLGRHLAVFGVVDGGTSGVALDQLFLVGRSLAQRWLGENTINLKVGRMDLDLFAVQPRLQRAATRPLTLSLAVGRDGFTLGDPAIAIELYGLVAGRLKWVLGAANGAKPVDDLSTRRDLFARVSAVIGGDRLDLRGGGAGSSAATTLAIGVAAYWGVGVVEPAPPEPRFANDLVRLLGDVRLRSHGFDLLGQVVLGQDSDPDGRASPVRHVAWLAEAEYPVLPWLIPYVRFEEARFDDPTHDERRRLLIGWAVFARANLRIRTEGVVGLTPTEAHQVVVDLFMAL